MVALACAWVVLGSGVSKLHTTVVFPLKDCFCFYLDVIAA